MFIETAADLPGFGGYYFDENGDLNVYLTDLSRASDAQRLLANVAHQRPERWRQPFGSAAKIVARLAKYDFPTLYAIKVQIANEVAAIPGVAQFDVDEFRNQVAIGVTTEQARQGVLARANALALPADAFVVDVIPRGEPATTLSDSVRPLVGGLQIEYVGGDNLTHKCTLGANAWYGNYAITPQIPSGTEGFFTAAHCGKTEANMQGSTWLGNSDDTVYTQAGVRIGVEAFDPPTFKYPNNLDCLASYPQCRYSDATFVKYDIGVSNSHGYFARTLWAGIGAGVANAGSKDLSGSQFAAGSLVTPVLGMQLEKVGYQSGWTEGNVVVGNISSTCVDQLDSASNIEILCSYHVNAFADNGDSGSSVFEILDMNNNVAFAGLVWWKTGGGTYYFSTQDSIKKDFGIGVNFLTH